jgi:hypothetical protein
MRVRRAPRAGPKVTRMETRETMAGYRFYYVLHSGHASLGLSHKSHASAESYVRPGGVIRTPSTFDQSVTWPDK